MRALESRRAPRFPIELWVKIDGVDSTSTRRTGDIRAQGIFFATEAAVGEVGCIHWLTLESRSKRHRFQVMAHVVRSFPLADANMVFIPYCTGDLHSGEATANLTLDGKTIPTYFWGGRNMAAYLARLVPTFVGTTRVFLAGGSAGGFGTLVNFDRVASAFGVRVDVIDDSGPPITGKGASGNAALGIWGYAAPRLRGQLEPPRSSGGSASAWTLMR